MKFSTLKYWFPLLMIAGILISGCRKEEIPVVIPEASEVNTFVFKGLRNYYLWNEMNANLTSSNYENKDSLNVFLNKFTDPQVLFTSLLYKYKEVDKWSFLADNSKTLENLIVGISETMGYDFMLERIGTSDNLVGIVRYVYKGSPAERAGVKRGDIFLKINDQQLTVTNYQTLLFTNKTYTMGFAKITITNTDITFSPSKAITMTAIEMQENPIEKDTVFTYNNQKVGYLVYNAFNMDFDVQLNDVFKKFKDAKIDQLVLDLRYNGGGHVVSSVYLASMIYGTDINKVFARSRYNSGLQAYYTEQYGANFLNNNFTTTIEKTDKHEAAQINTLNLQKIYIIVSDNTASASELLINGLRPYMNVKVIGLNTVGKYTGSATIKDWDENGNINPNHSYAMQPIIVKYSNSAGVSDFVDGLTPDIKAEEDLAALLPFGDPNETLLSVALADIKGISITSINLKSAKIGLTKFADSQDFKPYAKEMFMNPIQKKSE